ncbi:hypothetical protein SSPS47_27500 [Streptomyces sp. S4.7]|nr:hypothetical protein SSPS47_27500 [Streptomyces sp. S4.7]
MGGNTIPPTRRLVMRQEGNRRRSATRNSATDGSRRSGRLTRQVRKGEGSFEPVPSDFIPCRLTKAVREASGEARRAHSGALGHQEDMRRALVTVLQPRRDARVTQSGDIPAKRLVGLVRFQNRRPRLLPDLPVDRGGQRSPVVENEDGVIGTEIAPGESAGTEQAPSLEDRVHDLAQVMLGRPAEVQGPASALEAPGRQHRLGQLPARIGQITRIRTTFSHTARIPPTCECAQACVSPRGSTAQNRASWNETGANRLQPQLPAHSAHQDRPTRQPPQHHTITPNKHGDSRARSAVRRPRGRRRGGGPWAERPSPSPESGGRPGRGSRCWRPQSPPPGLRSRSIRHSGLSRRCTSRRPISRSIAIRERAKLSEPGTVSRFAQSRHHRSVMAAFPTPGEP